MITRLLTFALLLALIPFVSAEDSPGSTASDEILERRRERLEEMRELSRLSEEARNTLVEGTYHLITVPDGSRADGRAIYIGEAVIAKEEGGFVCSLAGREGRFPITIEKGRFVINVANGLYVSVYSAVTPVVDDPQKPVRYDGEVFWITPEHSSRGIFTLVRKGDE